MSTSSAPRTRVAVFVSGGGTNLQAIIDAAAAGKLPDAELACVVASRPDAYALERARAAGIPGLVADRRALGSQAAFERALLDCVEQAGAEIIVLAGFMSILSADFTSRFERRILNVHPALIPSFCGEGYYGLRVHRAALDKGVKVTGATVHFVNEIPDGGEIIAQKAVPVRKGDTPESLQLRVMQQAEWKLLPRAVQTVARDIRKGKEK